MQDAHADLGIAVRWNHFDAQRNSVPHHRAVLNIEGNGVACCQQGSPAACQLELQFLNVRIRKHQITGDPGIDNGSPRDLVPGQPAHLNRDGGIRGVVYGANDRFGGSAKADPRR